MLWLAVQTALTPEVIPGAPAIPEPLGFVEVARNATLAGLLGLGWAWTYRRFHQRLKYAAHFTQTLVFTTILIAMVMMVVEGSLARAFALVGALSIIRFRTVVEDVRDTAFVFGSLGLGMAAGTSHVLLACLAFVILFLLTWGMYASQFGAKAGRLVIFRMRVPAALTSSTYAQWVQDHAQSTQVLEDGVREGSDQRETVVSARCADHRAAQALLKALRRNAQVQEVRLLVSRTEREI